MPLEPGNSRPDGLVITNPAGSDSPSQGDDHIRLVKDALKTWSGAAGADASLVNYLNANYAAVSALAATDANVAQNTSDIATKAPIADPALTGNATVDGNAIVTADPANYLSNLQTVILNHPGGTLDAAVHKNKFVRIAGNTVLSNLSNSDRIDFFNNTTGNLTISGLVGLVGNGVRNGTQILLPGGFGGTLVYENSTFSMWIGAGSIS